MDAWNIATSCAARISMIGLVSSGKAFAQVFRPERTVRLLKTTQLRKASRLWTRAVSRCGKLLPGVCCISKDAHWAIENRPHRRRDVSLGEDACQIRTGLVPGLLAQLNSTVLSLVDRAGVRNVARQMRYFDAHVEQALALSLTGHCSVY